MYLIFRMQNFISIFSNKLEKFQAVEVFNTQMMELHEGQGMEIYWRDLVVLNPPTEAEYEKIVVKSEIC